MTLTGLSVRIGLAASLLVSAVSHAYLYIHGYQHIPTIGTAFLIQASVSFALAAADRTGWSRLAALGRRRPRRRLIWSPSLCRGPLGFSAFPNEVGTHHRTRRSVWAPKC